MMPRAGKLSDRLRVLRLADSLVRKPLVWSHSGPIASDRRVLCFLMFRSFVRALSQYRSLVLLLKSGAWEDALVLARSLYELNVNLELTRFGGQWRSGESEGEPRCPRVMHGMRRNTGAEWWSWCAQGVVPTISRRSSSRRPSRFATGWRRWNAIRAVASMG